MIRSNNGTIRLYRAFGLTIASDLDIPELPEAEGTADVNIMSGNVPGAAGRPFFKDRYFYAVDNKILFNIDGIGRYCIENGSLITVEPEKHSCMGLVRIFLLGTVFGVLLLQRGILPLHGSAVVIDGQCVVFTGMSGAGKSTLSSALRKMGYHFLSDDISAVKLDENGSAWVLPGYPQQKLRRDSVLYIGGNPDILLRLHEDTDKYYIPVKSKYAHDPVRLSGVYELSPECCRDVRLIKLTGCQKLKMLMKNTYRSAFVNRLGMGSFYLKQCMSLAALCSTYRLVRPEGVFTVDEQVAAVLGELNKTAFSKTIC